NLSQPGGAHRPDQFLVEIIHAGLAFKSQPQLPADNLLADPEAAIAIEREQRITDFDMRMRRDLAKLFHLIDDRSHRSCAVRRSDPMRTIRTVLRTTAAGEHGEGAR